MVQQRIGLDSIGRAKTTAMKTAQLSDEKYESVYLSFVYSRFGLGEGGSVVSVSVVEVVYGNHDDRHSDNRKQLAWKQKHNTQEHNGHADY